MTFRHILTIALLMTFTGCATITRGTKEILVVESDPVGANVTTSIGLTGKTPATFKVSRKGGFVVTIEKEGYETVQVQVSSQVAGGGAAGMAGNILLGGLIGAAVDAGSGATKELKPNPIVVKMVPKGSESKVVPPTPEGSDPSQLVPAPETTTDAPAAVSYLIEFVDQDHQQLYLSVKRI